MKNFLNFILLILITNASYTQTQESGLRSDVVAGTRVSLVPPAEFTPSTQFPGYLQESTGASIVVTEIPGSFSGLSFTVTKPAELAKTGITLLHEQQVIVNGQNALLLQAWQIAAGREFLKWILLFGNEKESVMMVAAFPKQLESELSDNLRTSLLTTSWDINRVVALTDGLNFALFEKGELKAAKRIGNVLLYTKGGVIPVERDDDPVFVISQAQVTVSLGDPESFARLRVLQNTSVTNVEIEQSAQIIIDELIGYEIIAKGTDAESGQPATIYQIILFEDKSYYIMLGTVGSYQKEVYLSVFRELAGSFRRNK